MSMNTSEDRRIDSERNAAMLDSVSRRNFLLFVEKPDELTVELFNYWVKHGCHYQLVSRYIITPEMAAYLLADDINSCNRSIRKRNLETLKTRWTDGEFQFTGEPIQISQEGNLLNGQHRLRATKETGVPIDVLVIFGMPQDVFAILDQGARRNWADVLSATGHQNAKKLAAAIAQMEAYSRNQFGRNNTAYRNANERHKGNEEVIELAARYPGLGDHVTNSSPFIGNSVLAATSYLTASISPSDSADFVAVLKNHDNVSNPTLFQDNALALRSRLLRAKTAKNPKDKLPQEVAAAYTVLAWNASRDGKQLRVFKWHGDKSPRFK